MTDTQPSQNKMPLNWGWAGLCLLMGAIIGTALTMVAFVLEHIVRAIFFAIPFDILAPLAMGIGLSSIIFPVFLFGLLILAAPIWALLHKMGLRSYPVAIALDVILTGAAAWYFLSLQEAWTLFLIMMVMGGITGYLIWFMAYNVSDSSNART